MQQFEPQRNGKPRLLVTKTLLATCVLVVGLLGATQTSAQICPFDDGNSTLSNDGVVLTRYALGIRGTALLANTDFASADPAVVESHIACPGCGLRITDDRDGLNNPIFTAADATIISRKLAGFSGNALTNGLALGSGSRNTPAAVNSFLLAGCGTTGGTVTSVTAGTGLAVSPNATGGSITTTGTIGIAAGGVTTSRLADGSVSSIKIADGSVTQAKLNEAIQPQAGYFLSSTGANPSGSLTWVPPPALSCVAGITDTVTVTSGNQDCATSTCPAGYTVTGGGVSSASTNTPNLFQYINYAAGNGWRVCIVVGGTGGSVNFNVNARCCKVD
jgi:hypothetical protein